MSYEQLWAPWRLVYLQGESSEPAAIGNEAPLLSGADPGCFLCRGAADSANRQRHVVHCGEHVVTVLNRYPYNNGHLLVAPRLHRAKLGELSTQEQCDLMKEIAQMIALLERVLRPEGFNVGLNLGRAAGAGLPDHLHWHIVPRWNGDTNFMPTLASVKVIPQALSTLWEALTTELAGP